LRRIFYNLWLYIAVKKLKSFVKFLVIILQRNDCEGIITAVRFMHKFVITF